MTTTATTGYMQTQTSDNTTNWAEITTTGDPITPVITTTAPLYNTQTFTTFVNKVVTDTLIARVDKKVSIYAFGDVTMRGHSSEYTYYIAADPASTATTISQGSNFTSYGVILDMGK